MFFLVVPIIPLSPIKILINDGNSSNDVERKNLPYETNLISSGSSFPSLSFSFVIVRNFNNDMILSFFPGLFCTKKGFPFIQIAPIIVKITSNGESTIKAHKLNIKSIALLKNLAYIKTYIPS